MNASNKKKSTKKRKKLVHENQLIQINAKKNTGKYERNNNNKTLQLQ